MNRRDVLSLVGAGGIIGGGIAGVYLASQGWNPLDEDSPSQPVPSDDDGENADIEDTDDDGESLPEEDNDDETQLSPGTRNGDFLSGVAPKPPNSTFDAFEEWVGETHAIVGMFVDMGATEDEIDELVNETFEAAWERGHVPHIYWQPFFPTREETSNEINKEIAAGEHDDTLTTWADTLAEWADDGEPRRRLYLNLAPEFNGDWSPWSPAVGDDTEEDFVAMWRHTHEVVMDAGLGPEHVQWIWTLDNTTRGVDREACYPGDEYVDWAGIHGYNWATWGGWRSAEGVYGSILDTTRSITDKPIAITEFGTSSETDDGDHDPEMKNEWIHDAYEFLRDEEVEMALWFNLVKETDWAVFGGEHGTDTIEIEGEEFMVYPAYKEAIQSDTALGRHPDHPLRLTQSEFAGEF